MLPYHAVMVAWWVGLGGAAIAVACTGCLTAHAASAGPVGLALVPITLPMDLALAIAADAAEHRADDEVPERTGPYDPFAPEAAPVDTRPAPPPDLMEKLDWVRACEGPDACATGTTFACVGVRGACRCTCVPDATGTLDDDTDGA